MTVKQHSKWQAIRARGRADYALRRGVAMGLFFWIGHALIGNWSGWRELILLLPFAVCIFITFHWFVLWPWREHDFMSKGDNHTSEQRDPSS
jgi:hypothetical protein